MKRTLFGELQVEVDDRACKEKRWKREPRHPETLRFLYKQLWKLKTPVMLDIGAGQGRYTLLAKHVPGVQCFCWEPNPQAYKYLVSNVRLNGLEDRVTTFQCGLWDGRREKTLYVPAKKFRFRSATMGNHPHKDQWRVVRVEVRPLDDFRKYWDRAGLIKLDVEGAELFVLKGAEKTIRKDMPAIWTETTEPHAAMFGYKRQEVLDLLRGWGYRNFEPHPPHDMWITR